MAESHSEVEAEAIRLAERQRIAREIRRGAKTFAAFAKNKQSTALLIAETISPAERRK